MTPDALNPQSFAGYTPAGRQFALEHLSLLRRLPLSICPSFLQQLQGMDTAFPAERRMLRDQCDALQQMPSSQLEQLLAPLRSLAIAERLSSLDWVSQPATFVTELTAYLWSSKQIDAFRDGASRLFAAIPAHTDSRHRLVIVVLGQDAHVIPDKFLQKLRRHGVYLTGLRHDDIWSDIQQVTLAHAQDAASPYDTWYVDGGVARPELEQAVRNGTKVSYGGLSMVRRHVLARIQQGVMRSDGNAEQMRTHLAETTIHDSDVSAITADPVLRRFYTELFTMSSGPQIFSTSFVQWTGRELARRVKPSTLVLRYAPRQQHQDMNTLFEGANVEIPDPQGSLRDAEMGTFYNWIEMNRISPPGRLTFAALAENHPFAVVLGASSPAGTSTASTMTLRQAVDNFG